jgi:hypothetical protein
MKPWGGDSKEAGDDWKSIQWPKLEQFEQKQSMKALDNNQKYKFPWI